MDSNKQLKVFKGPISRERLKGLLKMGNAQVGGIDTIQGVPKFFHIKPPTYKMITKWGIDPLYYTSNPTINFNRFPQSMFS